MIALDSDSQRQVRFLLVDGERRGAIGW